MKITLNLVSGFALAAAFLSSTAAHATTSCMFAVSVPNGATMIEELSLRPDSNGNINAQIENYFVSYNESTKKLKLTIGAPLKGSDQNIGIETKADLRSEFNIQWIPTRERKIEINCDATEVLGK